MSAKAFDKKFGAALVATLPKSPGVYRFLNEDAEVIYVGKAKDLRKRLQGYRNASRKRVHRKMRTLVKEACHFEYESLSTEKDALLRENALIRELRPLYNVDGAYAFLYPSVGVLDADKHLILCFTTSPEHYTDLPMSWYGCFRSRPRCKQAFDSLCELLSLLGHREKRNALPPHEAVKGSRLIAFRQVPHEIAACLPWFFAGQEPGLLGEISKALLLKPRARRDAATVQEQLVALKSFYEQDAVRLNTALRTLGKPGSYVSQENRDALFIEYEHRTDPKAL